LLCKIHKKQCKIAKTDLESIIKQVELVYLSGWKREKLNDITEKEVCEFVEHLSKKYGVEGLSDKERLKIVAAIGLDKGHWYKCPNGHYYCIADCGGAVETSKCPDCNKTIGGTQHQLASGNQHAPEMDDSEYPAWSNEANANFLPIWL